MRLFDEKLRKFDERMSLWHKMRQVTGADQMDATIFDNMREEIRESLITCQECAAAITCAAWLRETEPGAEPPEFCQNRNRFVTQ